MNHGIYIHIPFCRKKCDYCGFYSVPSPRDDSFDETADRYVARLIGEFDERLMNAAITADTVYFGGGTPSMLEPGQVYEILRGLEARVTLDPDTEITMEVNPEDAAAERLAGFRDAGVNRLVLGVQTLSERISRVIGRSAGACRPETLEAFFGVPDVIHCADLITGIPSQGGDELERDLAAVTAYRPAHISAYLLSVEKGTPLEKRMSPAPGDESSQAGLFEHTGRVLHGAGYNHYEISNYSLPGFESRHNMKYWRFEPYIGFGPGAHSFVDDERYYNAMPVAEYLASGATRLEHDARDVRAAAVEYLMTGLRLLSGVSIGGLEERLRFRLPEEVNDRIDEAVSRGFIVRDGAGPSLKIRLTEKGLIISDAVIYRIVEPLVGS